MSNLLPFCSLCVNFVINVTYEFAYLILACWLGLGIL